MSGFAPFTCLVIYLIHDDISNQSKKKSAVAAELDVMTDACLLELSSSVSVSLSLCVYPSIIIPSTYLGLIISPLPKKSGPKKKAS